MAGLGKLPIDIVLSTRNRLELLVETLERLYEYTTAPYQLHVIDDNSSEGNVDFLIQEFKEGRVHHLSLRGERCGPQANANLGTWLAFSDPVVFTDDDVLCPKVEPDWLSRGLEALKERPKLGVLALNHPAARRVERSQDEKVTYCKCVGGTFMFIRRPYLVRFNLRHMRGNFGHVTTYQRSCNARKFGWQVGYLSETFCYHTGKVSANGHKYGGRFIEPEDWDTLRPPEKCLWRPDKD